MSSETRKNITEEQRLRRNESSRKSKQKKRNAERSIVPANVVVESHTRAEETPCFLNPHTAEIDKRIEAFQKSRKWNTKIINTTHADFIADFGSNVFTNFVHDVFTKAYMKKHNCADCGKKSENRCHGIGDERPILIRRALERVWPDTSKEIAMKDIMIAFLEEHKNTKFALKCRACHVNEGKP
jgi:hypothetical protein